MEEMSKTNFGEIEEFSVLNLRGTEKCFNLQLK